MKYYVFEQVRFVGVDSVYWFIMLMLHVIFNGQK